MFHFQKKRIRRAQATPERRQVLAGLRGGAAPRVGRLQRRLRGAVPRRRRALRHQADQTALPQQARARRGARRGARPPSARRAGHADHFRRRRVLRLETRRAILQSVAGVGVQRQDRLRILFWRKSRGPLRVVGTVQSPNIGDWKRTVVTENSKRESTLWLGLAGKREATCTRNSSCARSARCASSWTRRAAARPR